MKKAKVAIIMGSDSDLKVMGAAAEILESLQIPFHIEVVSAHRTPTKMADFAKAAEKKGFDVIIAGAGGAAHLPGMVAAHTLLPVIGVPVNIGAMNGFDSLLSIVQMPKGVPVATMAIDNAFNAGLLAARMLATHDSKLRQRLRKFQNQQRTKVRTANKKLKTLKKETFGL